MPIDKFVLIIVVIFAAAGATLWLAGVIAAAISIPFGWLGIIPSVLVGYVAFRVIAERVGNDQEDHYDNMEN